MLKDASFGQILLIFAIIFMPISNMPVTIPLVGRALSSLFLLIGLFCYIYKVGTRKENIGNIEKFFLYYLLIVFLWKCICSILGVVNFHYYNLVWLEHIAKLRSLLQTFQGFDFNVSDIAALKIWIGIRTFKNCILRVLLTYGISVWVFHLYQNNKQYYSRKYTFLIQASYAVLILCFVMIVYSVFEIGYLRGNLFCANLLSSINPFLYEAQSNHGWWPPLLWKNQLRSLFAEPSYFGIASTFIVPVLFYKILKYNNNILTLVCYGVFIIMLFMTRARTAVLLFIIQSFLLFVYAFGVNQKYIKKSIKIFFVSGLSFCIALFLISGFKDVSDINNKSYHEEMRNAASDYIKDNVLSAIGNKRSNNARFANVRATVLTGLQHPVFGVGIDLSTPYAISNFKEEDLDNGEVRDWAFYIKQDGLIKSVFPILNQFSGEIAQYGIPGLIMYLLPVFLILRRLLKLLKKGLNVEIACTFIAYIGTFIAMFSNVAFFTYYILTGVMLALLYDKRKGESDYEIN